MKIKPMSGKKRIKLIKILSGTKNICTKQFVFLANKERFVKKFVRNKSDNRSNGKI